MADLSITATNVEESNSPVILTGRAAEAITAGQALYRLADSTYGLADADNASALIHKAVGIALNPAAAGQRISLQTAGRINIGATVTVGEIYVLSGTAGGIAPEADLAAGDEVVILGVGYDADEILLNIWPTGITVAA